MNVGANAVAAYFKTRQLYYELAGETQNAIRTVIEADSPLKSIDFYLCFSEDSRDVAIIAQSFVSFEAAQRDKMFEKISAANKKYRWVKFYAEDNNTVTAQIDEVISLSTCGKNCFELLGTMCSIISRAAADFQK